MPNNEWDDVVGTVLHQQTQDTATQVRNNVVAAAGTNPDAEAGFRHLANFMDVPIETARDNAQALRQQAATQQMDAGKLAQDFPHTAKFLTDLDNTRIVHDDVPATAAVEQAVKALAPKPARAAPVAEPEEKGLWQSLKDSPYALVQGLAGSYNKAAGSLNLVLGAFPTLYDKATSLVTGKANTSASDWWFRNMVDPRVQQQTYFEPDRNAGFSEKAFHTTGNLAGMLSQIILAGTGGETPAAAQSVGQLVTNATEHGLKAMAFPALSDAVDTGRRVYTQTGDATAAARAAQMQYATSTMGGMVPLNTPGNLLTRVTTGFGSGVATSETSRQLMNAVMPDSMQQPFSAEDMILGGIAGSILGGVMGPRAEPNYHEAIRQTYVDAARADAAQKNGEMVAALGQVSAASKLRERDPQAFRDFVQQVTEDGHLSEVYVDANELVNALHQSGVTQADLAAKMPEVAEQLHEALQTKGDVRIPVADYATHIAGGPVDQAILPHLKAEPDGMTYQEGQAFYQQQAETMKAQAEKIMQAKQADDAHQEQAQKIYDGMLEQLGKTQRFPDHVNKAYAALTRDFYVTTANRLGIAPDELMARYPLEVRAEQMVGAKTLDQPLHSEVLDADKPLSQQDYAVRYLLKGEIKRLRAEAWQKGETDFDPDQADSRITGQQLVDRIAERLGSKEEAKAYLESLGITGVRSGDGQARTPFPELTLDQAKRGAISFGDDITERPSVITLFKQADMSTFLHEGGHFFLEVTHDIARRPDAPASIRQDMNTLLDWFGIKDTPETSAIDAWNGMSLEQKREFHEQFARGFEAYLMEGKAPSVEAANMFARFRAWLVSVYQSLASLNVQLTDEVRGVMDRLLASEEAIKQAEQVRGYRPLFESAQAAGMTPEQFADYQKLGANATQEAITDLDRRSLRDMQWLSNAKSKALKALQKEADSKRKAIREQVTREVMADPVRQAEAYLKRPGGTDPAPAAEAKTWQAARETERAKLLEIVKAEYLAKPEAAEAKGLKKGQFLTKNKRAIENEAERRLIEWEQANPRPVRPKVDIDIVAEMFGFTDGKELKAAIEKAGKLKDQIEGMTDQRMLEEHGELVDPASIERAAEAAIHNEARARFVATELKALAEANDVRQQVGTSRKGHKVTVDLLAKAAKEAAEAAIAAKRVRDLRPAQYAAAEARAAKAADKALASGDLQAAAVEKRAQLLNNRLTKVAAEAIEEVRKGVDYLKKFDKPGVRENIDLEYRDQIDTLLDRYDLRKSTSGAALDKREALLAFVERMAAQGYEPQIPEKLLNEANRMHYKDLPVEEFRGLVDAVKSIEHLGRLKTRLLDLHEMRELNDLAAEVQAVTSKLPQRDAETNRGLTGIEAKWLNVKSAGRSLQAALLKMEQMFDWLDDRNPNGVFNRVVFRRIADAGVKEADLQAKVKAEIDKLLESHLADVTREKGKIYVAEGLIDGLTGQPQKFTKKEMLALAGNVGNESNLAKLVAGEKWDEAKVWAFLHQNMSKADWDFVAGLGRALEALWPEKLAMSRRLGNTNPEKIAPRPFDTPHGRHDGWYWPMVYDPARAQDVAERGARAGDALFENIYTRANTDTGRMNTRNENYARPLLLSLDVIPRVIKDEIHDIAYREAIIDADKFLSFKPVREAIQNALSPEHYDQLRPWLQSIANDRKVDMQALKWFDRLAHGARTRATIVGLGYRISTMLVHGSSAAMESVAELGPRWMAAGLADFANPVQWAANRDFIFERSGEMRNRMNEVDRDVREHLREIDLRLMDTTTGTVARGTDLLKAHAYQGIAMLDMASAIPTWMGAYHKAMAPKSKGGLGMGEKDAVYFADKTVRNAHGGSGVKDLAAVQRGPEFFKLFTMFYTFWNHNVNRLMDTARMAKELPDTFRNGAPGEFRGDLGAVIMRTLIYTLGVQTMHHMLHPSKDDQGETNWLAWAAKELTAAAFAGVPVLRDLSAHYLTGKDYSATPAAGVVAAIGNSGVDAMHAAMGEQVSEKWLKHTITTAGYVFGLPLGQPSSTIQFLWDVSTGKQTPQDTADWWRGVLHGDMKPH